MPEYPSAEDLDVEALYNNLLRARQALSEAQEVPLKRVDDELRESEEFLDTALMQFGEVGPIEPKEKTQAFIVEYEVEYWGEDDTQVLTDTCLFRVAGRTRTAAVEAGRRGLSSLEFVADATAMNVWTSESAPKDI